MIVKTLTIYLSNYTENVAYLRDWPHIANETKIVRKDFFFAIYTTCQRARSSRFFFFLFPMICSFFHFRERMLSIILFVPFFFFSYTRNTCVSRFQLTQRLLRMKKIPSLIIMICSQSSEDNQIGKLIMIGGRIKSYPYKITIRFNSYKQRRRTFNDSYSVVFICFTLNRHTKEVNSKVIS